MGLLVLCTFAPRSATADPEAVRALLQTCVDSMVSQDWAAAERSCAAALEADAGPTTRVARRSLIDHALITSTPAQFMEALAAYPTEPRNGFEHSWLAQREGVAEVYRLELGARTVEDLVRAQSQLRGLELADPTLQPWRERMVLWLGLRTLDLRGDGEALLEGLALYLTSPGLWPSERARAEGLELKVEAQRANAACQPETTRALVDRLERLEPLPPEDRAWAAALVLCSAPTSRAAHPGQATPAARPDPAGAALVAWAGPGRVGVSAPETDRRADLGGAGALELRVQGSRPVALWAQARAWYGPNNHALLDRAWLWSHSSAQAQLGGAFTPGRWSLGLGAAVQSVGEGQPVGGAWSDTHTGSHRVQPLGVLRLGIEPLPPLAVQAALAVGLPGAGGVTRQGQLSARWVLGGGSRSGRFHPVLGLEGLAQRTPICGARHPTPPEAACDAEAWTQWMGGIVVGVQLGGAR